MQWVVTGTWAGAALVALWLAYVAVWAVVAVVVVAATYPLRVLWRWRRARLRGHH